MDKINSSQPNPIDKIMDKLILWLIPRKVTPNHFTIIRLLSVPLIAFLLLREEYALGVALFSFFAFTDAIDGALARTRNQITSWGTIMDPVADKLLIGVSALTVIYRFDPIAAIAMAGLDIVIGITALYHLHVKRVIVNPHITGKIKMILQSFGVIFALFFLMTGASEVELVARVLIYFALGMGLISVAVYRSA